VIATLVVLGLILLVGWLVGWTIAGADGVIPIPVAVAVALLPVLVIIWVHANQVYG
jgi:uncharacterized protein (DUF697 family)